MSLKCEEIIKHMESIAPSSLALDWDNVGLIVGDSAASVSTILIALDITDEVIEEAIKIKAELIITHHPMIFKSINKINNETPVGRRILKLISNGICVYSSHTNLDIADGGTNDTLFKLLNLQSKEHFLECNTENYSLGKVGTLKNNMTLKEFSSYVKSQLKLTSIRFSGDSEEIITKVALCTGAASSYEMFKKAKEKGCDVFITGDIKYHDAQLALEMGLCLVDATHYASEVIVNNELKNNLADKLKNYNINIIISKIDGQTFKNV